VILIEIVLIGHKVLVFDYLICIFFFIWFNQISFFRQLQKDLVDIKFLSWLGAESYLFMSFLGDLYMKISS